MSSLYERWYDPLGFVWTKISEKTTDRTNYYQTLILWSVSQTLILSKKLEWPFHVTFDGIVRFSQFFVTQGTPKSEIICEIQINLIIDNNCHFLPFLNLFTWIFVQNQSVILTNFLSHKVHQKANCNGMPRLWLCYNVFILHWFWPGLFMKLQQKIGRNLSLHFNAKEGHSEVECQFPVKPLFLVHNESS